jgi:hypothetical protein
MKEVHTIVEELVMGKEPQLYSVLNREVISGSYIILG